MTIRPYTAADQAAMFAMLREEGDEWADYWGEAGCELYAQKLLEGFVLVAYDKGELCGYVSARDDHGFEVVVYDLLVRPFYRGKCIGRALLDGVVAAFPGKGIYVMSDADGYYEKQGYQKAGTLFEVK